MSLDEIAQEAMGYLDSVGVAADFSVTSKFVCGIYFTSLDIFTGLDISTTQKIFTLHEHVDKEVLMGYLNEAYPKESPC